MSQLHCSPGSVQKLGWQSWAQFIQKRRLVCPSTCIKATEILLLYFSVKWPQLRNRGFTLPVTTLGCHGGAWKLSLIQLQANKLLHALPVLHLSRAVGIILTWLAVGSLRLSHLLVHLCQTQSREQVEGKKVDEPQLKLLQQLQNYRTEPTVTPGGSNRYFKHNVWIRFMNKLQ